MGLLNSGRSHRAAAGVAGGSWRFRSATIGPRLSPKSSRSRSTPGARDCRFPPDRRRAPDCCSRRQLRRSRSPGTSRIGRRRAWWFVNAEASIARGSPPGVPQLRHRVRRRRALPVRAPRACWPRGLQAPARLHAAALWRRKPCRSVGSAERRARRGSRALGGARQRRPYACADNEAGAPCVRLRRRGCTVGLTDQSGAGPSNVRADPR